MSDLDNQKLIRFTVPDLSFRQLMELEKVSGKTVQKVRDILGSSKKGELKSEVVEMVCFVLYIGNKALIPGLTLDDVLDTPISTITDLFDAPEGSPKVPKNEQ